MDINSRSYRAYNTELNVFENSISNMERTVISARESRIENLYRFQQHSMGIVDASHFYSFCRPLCTDILRKYYYAFICKEIWGYDFTQITRDSRKYLEILLKNKYSTTSDLRTINTKSSKCSEQINCTNGIVNVGSNIHTVKQAVRRSRHRSICISKQHKITNVLQLVPRPQGSKTKCLSAQLEIVGKPILLPALEPDNTSDQKGTSGKNNTNNYNPVLQDCNMVPGPTGTVYPTATASTSNHSLGNYAVDFIVCNKRRIRRRIRYNSTQQRFLEWKRSKNLTDSISAAQIVNYLAEIYFTDKLKPSTIKAYKSAILGLVEDTTEITNQRIFKEFFKTLNESSIRSFIKPSINIGPILITFSNWGPNSEIAIKNLTSKLSWLLAVTGLLRSSNIHRIDDARTHITNGALHLVIIAPKEKRGGQPVERPCQIAEHSNPIMCPNSSWMIYRLLRQVNRHEKPFSAICAALAAQAGASADDIVNHAFWSNYSIFDSHYRLSRDLKDNLTELIIPLE
ncbi:hypothetical protein BB561_003071 [Smittium simulii]|uniref:Core-binding (CB) domain-containing protein n=1 Tax=Smittium simulii TaxID=133385 RepID=A0A2T9YN23_9FUNG|nr:hypothetical protein BB561_003071 [Smittium simulii]